MKPNILFVDDEVNVLDGLRRSLRDQANDWDMSFASSGHEALEIMLSSTFDIIVSDMKMPEMSGDELLNITKDLYPDTIRIVLTGHLSKEWVFRLVNSNHLYLSKPCPKDVFIKTISDALGLRKTLTAIGSEPDNGSEFGPLSNEEMTTILFEFIKNLLLRGIITSSEVPAGIADRMPANVLDSFAPVINEREYVDEHLNSDEYNNILNSWLVEGEV